MSHLRRGCLLNKKKKAVNVGHRTSGREFYTEKKLRSQEAMRHLVGHRLFGSTSGKLSNAHDSKNNVSGVFRGSCKYFQGVRAARL